LYETFSICLILFALIYRLPAQTKSATSQPPDPKFINHIYYYAGDSLSDLEQATARMVNKTKGFGYGGSETGYEIEGEKSSMRISTKNEIRFVVKMGTGMMDPSMMIRLYRLRSAKNKREAVLDSQSGYYGKSKKTDDSEITYNIQKSGADVFIIIPSSRLSSGEYGFVNMMLSSSSGRKMSFTMFSFGVDREEN